MTTDDMQIDTDTWAVGDFEPCAVFEGADIDGVCTICGWLADDHEHDAEVVSLPPVITPAMRRAS